VCVRVRARIFDYVQKGGYGIKMEQKITDTDVPNIHIP
jgi:hypothetical protein